MAEIAALGLRIDGISDVKKSGDALDKLAKSADGAARSQEKLAAAASGVKPQLSFFSSAAKKAADAMGGLGASAVLSARVTGAAFSAAASSIKTRVSSFIEDAKKASENITGFSTAAVRAAGLIGAAFSVVAIKNYADAWSDMQSRVGAATGDMAGAAANMQRLVDIANASYSPLQQTVDVYARNVATFRDLGRSANEAADFTEALNHALIVTATKGQDAEVVTNALSRSLAKGKLDAEAFDTIVSRSPRVLQAMADSMGVSTSAMRQLAIDGEVTSDVIAGGIIQSLGKLSAEAAEMPATIGDAFVRVQNNVTELVGTIDKATGASSAISEAIMSAANGVRTFGVYAAAAATLMQPAFSAIGSAIGAVTKYADVALVALTGFATPMLIGGVVALASALATGLVGAIKMVTAAMMANPIGLLVAALALAGYAAYQFRDEIEEAIGIDVVQTAKDAANMLIGSFMAAYEAISFTWANLGDIIGGAAYGAVNMAISAINTLIKSSLAGMNLLIDGINKIPGVKIPNIAIAIPELKNAYAQRLKAAAAGNKSIAKAFTKDYVGAISDGISGAMNKAGAAGGAAGRAKGASSGAGGGKAGGGASAQNDAAQRLIDSLSQQVYNLEKRTALEKLYADIQKDNIQLTAAQMEKAVGLAKAIDAAAIAERNKKAEIDKQNLAYQLQESLLSKQQGYQKELAAYGMGSKAGKEAAERISIQQQQQKELRDMAQQHQQEMRAAETEGERAHLQSMYQQRVDMLQSSFQQEIALYDEYLIQKQEKEANAALGVQQAMQDFLDNSQNLYQQAQDMTTSLLEDAQSKISDGFMAILDGSKSAGDAVKDMARGMAQSVIKALVDMAAQWLVYKAVQMFVGKSTQSAGAGALSANAAATSLQAGIAAFASTAAIPVVGPALAPGAMKAAISATAPMAAAISGLALAGMAHDGIDSVPREGTWLLDKGERVMTANTSAKMDGVLERIDARQRGAMSGGAAGGGQVAYAAPIINIIEDSSKAGQVTSERDAAGNYSTDIFVSNIMRGGEEARVLESTYNLKRVGT